MQIDRNQVVELPTSRGERGEAAQADWGLPAQVGRHELRIDRQDPLLDLGGPGGLGG